MLYATGRVTIRSSGLYQSASAFFNTTTRLLTKTMEVDPNTKKTGPIVYSLRTMNSGESKYARPVRMHFSLNGKERGWDCLKAHDSVACVIYNKDRNKLIYVKQFRPAVYLTCVSKGPPGQNVELKPEDLDEPANDRVGYTMELCAGLADKEGFTPIQVMRDEIKEETGYYVPDLENIHFISSFRGSTGLSGALMNLYYTEVTDKDKSFVGGGVDDEAIEVMELDIEEARKVLYCRDEDAPYSRPPAMLFGTAWFLNERLPKLEK